MISGIVYWPDIILSVKDETGIENMEQIYPKIRRLVFRAEKDIAAGGLIVRKTKTYTNGDGAYDGRYIKLPEDFIGEYSYADLNTVEFRGNRLELIDYSNPPETIDLFYMGVLMDPEGNPITTHNHFDAVVAYCVWKLYTPMAFGRIAGASLNQLDYYKRNYEDACMAARGHDAFPTEEEWEKIGNTLRMPLSGLMAQTNCGLQYIDYGQTSTQPVDPGQGGGTCGDLTVDMVAVYEASK